MKEIWIDIKGYEGLYQVSNYGNVRSLDRTSIMKNGVSRFVLGRELRKKDNGHGYLIVSLYKHNVEEKKYVHRLVGNAFILNPNNLPDINHKDENKSNNNVNNLEWCTKSYNSRYGTKIERGRETLKEHGGNRGIDVYDKEGHFIRHYDYSYDLTKDGLDRRLLYAVCKGRLRSYKGLVYRFEGDPFSWRKRIKKEKSSTPVQKIDLKGEVVEEYKSIREAEKSNGLGRNYLYAHSFGRTVNPIINGYKYIIK